MPLRAALNETFLEAALGAAHTAFNSQNNDDGDPGNPLMIQVVASSSHGVWKNRAVHLNLC